MPRNTILIGEPSRSSVRSQDRPGLAAGIPRGKINEKEIDHSGLRGGAHGSPRFNLLAASRLWLAGAPLPSSMRRSSLCANLIHLQRARRSSRTLGLTSTHAQPNVYQISHPPNETRFLQAASKPYLPTYLPIYLVPGLRYYPPSEPQTLPSPAIKAHANKRPALHFPPVDSRFDICPDSRGSTLAFSSLPPRRCATEPHLGTILWVMSEYHERDTRS